MCLLNAESDVTTPTTTPTATTSYCNSYLVVLRRLLLYYDYYSTRVLPLLLPQLLRLTVERGVRPVTFSMRLLTWLSNENVTYLLNTCCN